MTIVLQHQYWDLILGPDFFGDGELQQSSRNASTFRSPRCRRSSTRRSASVFSSTAKDKAGTGKPEKPAPATSLPAPEKRLARRSDER